jgi:hypothetical protein
MRLFYMKPLPIEMTVSAERWYIDKFKCGICMEEKERRAKTNTREKQTHCWFSQNSSINSLDPYKFKSTTPSRKKRYASAIRELAYFTTSTQHLLFSQSHHSSFGKVEFKKNWEIETIGNWRMLKLSQMQV